MHQFGISLLSRSLGPSAAALQPSALHAQIDSATVAGRITDSAGAAVPGADVTITNTETNFVYDAKSNTSGEWTISPVHITSFRSGVTAAGLIAY